MAPDGLRRDLERDVRHLPGGQRQDCDEARKGIPRRHRERAEFDRQLRAPDEVEGDRHGRDQDPYHAGGRGLRQVIGTRPTSCCHQCDATKGREQSDPVPDRDSLPETDRREDHDEDGDRRGNDRADRCRRALHAERLRDVPDGDACHAERDDARHGPPRHLKLTRRQDQQQRDRHQETHGGERQRRDRLEAELGDRDRKAPHDREHQHRAEALHGRGPPGIDHGSEGGGVEGVLRHGGLGSMWLAGACICVMSTGSRTPPTNDFSSQDA